MSMIYEISGLQLCEEDLMVNETIFHNANGYIGVRSNFEEGYPNGIGSIRGSYINGFYDFTEMSQAEKLCGLVEEKQTILNVVDAQTITCTLGEETFSMFEGTVSESRRYLDMEGGFTVREVLWTSPGGKEMRLTVRRMASFAMLPLFTVEYQVESLNYDGPIVLRSLHNGSVENYSNPNDPRVAGESKQYLFPEQPVLENSSSFICSTTSKSGLHVCTGVHHVLSKEGKTEVDVNGFTVAKTMETMISAGETVTLTKYTVFADSIRHSDCSQTVKRDMAEAISKPLSDWYAAQKAYLAQFWAQSELVIEGDDDLALATRYNQYQLLQSVGKDEHCNISAKGLSGEGYEGHYFWDTEMYIQPFFTLTNPKVARALVEHRYSILDYARENARILGHKKGALYPWRTIMGKECSGYFPSGTAQYHINGDIAYATIAYYLATKDLDFMAEKGAEIIFETARLWMDTGNFYQGKFHINDVTGPDEYTCIVNNNYFTNVSAQYTLHWAQRFYDLLKGDARMQALTAKLGITEEEMQGFAKAEQAMYLPYDEELGINPQDDSFLQKEVWDIENTPKEQFPLLLHYHPLYLYRFQVCKQADTVLSHFVFEDAQSLETMRKSFLYYEKVTTHDSSLSTCIFSIVASKLGMVDKAYDYFGDSAKLDLFNTHHNTKDGIHTANMGGNYMAIVYGFAGLRLKESGIYFAPTLPKQWTGYRFRMMYEGRRLQVEVRQGHATFTLLEGAPVEIHVGDTAYLLNDHFEVDCN